jgi:DNA-binding NarL/FixJ family response regulator
LATGLLWASRDYSRTRPFYERAVALARELGDQRILARALNRLGNWYSNAGFYTQSRAHLDEALGIFRLLEDSRGIAETLDLLGMTALLGARLDDSYRFFEEAARRFEDLGDKRGQIVPLASISSGCATYQSAMLKPSLPLPEGMAYLEHALALAQEVGAPGDVAYCMFQIGFCAGALGRYDRALAAAREGLAIARRSDHRQWTAATLCALGAIYIDLLQPETAMRHLTEGVRLSHEIGSEIWVAEAVCFSTDALLLLGRTDEAEMLIRDNPAAGDDADFMFTRLWRTTAEAELAFAKGEYGQVEALIERASQVVAIGDRLQRLLALIDWRRGKQAQAIERLNLIATLARQRGSASIGWRVQADLSGLLLELGRREEARTAAEAALATLDEIGRHISDEALRESFLGQAMNQLPAAFRRRSSRSQVEGLTAREAEIAAMVARGMSNRGIADELVLSARTVESHIANAMAKLGFTSRAQLAAWAVEHGATSA